MDEHRAAWVAVTDSVVLPTILRRAVADPTSGTNLRVQGTRA